MEEKISVDFSSVKDGVAYEEWVAGFLSRLKFSAVRTGKNDGGIDIVALAKVRNVTYKFNIQCKFHNKPLGKTAIQEVYAGTAYRKNNARPVVITNNFVTVEARLYAKELDVEIISDPEWEELRRIIDTGKVTNPNPYGALMGLIVGAITKDVQYMSVLQCDEEKEMTRREQKRHLVWDFEKAKEYEKEAAYLQVKAAQYKEYAFEIQKRLMLRNLPYT